MNSQNELENQSVFVKKNMKIIIDWKNSTIYSFTFSKNEKK